MNNNSTAVIGCIASGLVSLLLVICMWVLKREDSFWKKFIWTIILFVPLLGWLFYAAFYNPPPIQPENLRARYSGKDGRGSILLSIKTKRLDEEDHD
jgi:hypothetical protein